MLIRTNKQNSRGLAKNLWTTHRTFNKWQISPTKLDETGNQTTEEKDDDITPHTKRFEWLCSQSYENALSKLQKACELFRVVGVKIVQEVKHTQQGWPSLIQKSKVKTWALNKLSLSVNLGFHPERTNIPDSVIY